LFPFFHSSSISFIFFSVLISSPVPLFLLTFLYFSFISSFLLLHYFTLPFSLSLNISFTRTIVHTIFGLPRRPSILSCQTKHTLQTIANDTFSAFCRNWIWFNIISYRFTKIIGSYISFRCHKALNCGASCLGAVNTLSASLKSASLHSNVGSFLNWLQEAVFSGFTCTVSQHLWCRTKRFVSVRTAADWSRNSTGAVPNS